MEKTELLYEGKAKKVYAMSDPNYCMVEYKDDATAFNGLKKGTITGKGVVNNRMSNFMFKLLAEKGIPTHFVEEINDRETVVKKVKIVPLEVIIRNKAAGSMAKRLGLEEGTELKTTVLEWMTTSAIRSSTPITLLRSVPLRGRTLIPSASWLLK